MHLPQFKATSSMGAMAALLLSATGTPALPTAMSSAVSEANTLLPRSVDARGFNGMGPATLYRAVKDFLKDSNAYDPATPDKCVVRTETTDGGNCVTLIQCENTDRLSSADYMPTWNVCFLGGRQFFEHPQIGKFSIEYTKAGGKDGNTEDGLHHPVMKFENLNDWEDLDVEHFIELQKDDKHGNLCVKQKAYPGTTIIYACGIPKLGTAGFGLSMYKPVDPAPGYTPGWCTMHVAQHQRNEYGIGADYAFDVVIYDGAKKLIGKVQKQAIRANDKTLSVTSYLPWTVEVIAAGGDNDPVVFKYEGQTWQTGDGTHQNTLGNGKNHGYESGNREGDMGFTCN